MIIKTNVPLTPKVPIYGGFHVSEKNVLTIPCKWCGDAIAESQIDENLAESFGSIEGQMALVEHIKTNHANLLTKRDANSFYLDQSCSKCQGLDIEVQINPDVKTTFTMGSPESFSTEQ
jgi:ribosomal protein S27E